MPNLTLDRFLRLLPPRALDPLPRYVAATAAVFIAAGIRMLLPLVGLPYFVFIPAMMVVGFLFGVGAGLYATCLSAVVSTYLFAIPAVGGHLGLEDWGGAAAYALVNCGVVAVCAGLRQSLARRDAVIAALERSEQQLALSDQHLMLALEAAAGSVGIWDWDLETDLVYADANSALVYGVDPIAAARGIPFAEYVRNFHPEDRQVFQSEFERQFAGAAAFSSEYRVYQPDGSARWLLARGRLIRDDAGTPLRFAGASVDITDRKQAEAYRVALLGLDDRLRNLDDTAEMSYAAAEILGKTLGVSRAGYGIVDSIRETITIERDWTAPGVASLAGVLRFREYGSYIDDLKRGDLVVFADARSDPRTAATAAALEEIGARAVFNLPLSEAGSVVALLFLNHADAREWAADEIAFVRSIADHTRSLIERRRAEHDLRVLAQSLEQQVLDRTRDLQSSEARVKAYFNASPEYLYLLRLTSDGRLVFEDINFAGEALYRRDRWEILGRTPAEVVEPETAAKIESHARECLRTGSTLRYESIRDVGTGTRKTLDVVVAPIKLPDEGGNLVLLCGRDLTEQRRAEEALRQSQKMEAVGQLTGGIAHDFNNLLTGITGSLQLLETRIRQGRVGEVERYITSAQRSADRASSLTHRLLAFSRQQALDPAPVQVDRLVAGMEELLRRTIGPAINLEIVGTAGLWTVLVDPNQLENALLNLSINARDAMPEGGRLTIETANRWMDDRTARQAELVPGQFVSLSVSDTGIGMTPEVVKRAFDPFFTTKPLGMGTGLGLSMIYGFARQSGGQVRIYSEVGKGTTVRLYLPRHHGVGEAPVPVSEAPEIPVPVAGETVLVVDDETIVRMLVREVVQDIGLNAIDVEDGVAGLQVVKSDARIDLLITDVGLPGGLNGRELADRARLARPGLKVLFITGYAENAVIGHGHLEPGMQVLTKPFSIESLGNRIRMIMAD